jgi:hypothetical protein
MEREKGPVEILCKEIGFRFGRHMEKPEVLVSFVAVLVGQVADIRGVQASIAEIPGIVKTSHPAPSEDSAEVLRRVQALLALGDVARASQTMIDGAAEVHNFIHEVSSDEDEPCDHLIDMLSSCVSAIRFGLETPCHSRHAAEAASHIWRKRYGLTLEDEFTGAWAKDWTRAQLQDAIFRLHTGR